MVFADKATALVSVIGYLLILIQKSLYDVLKRIADGSLFGKGFKRLFGHLDGLSGHRSISRKRGIGELSMYTYNVG